MAQQVQHVFKVALAKTAASGQRTMSTGIIGTLEGGAAGSVKQTPKHSSGLHMTIQRTYPLAAVLPLPPNIDATETSRFSPLRSRDINASAMLTHQSTAPSGSPIDVTVDMSSSSANTAVDPHVESYDCRGAVSLNSAMQSNVPSPFGGMHKFTHLNMPGGAWAQESKFLSHELNSSHYTNLRQEVRSDWSSYEDRPVKGVEGRTDRAKGGAGSITNLCQLLTLTSPNHSIIGPSISFRRPFSGNSRQPLASALSRGIQTAPAVHNAQSKGNASTNVTNEERQQPPIAPPEAQVPVSRKDRLKKAIKEYGSTVLVFHVSISLVSLGTCYLLVSSGIDMVALLERFGWGDSALASKAGAGAGTFVIAYAIHKVFAPVRISITLGATPLIVRYLRRKGILKPPPKPTSTTGEK
ncbi:uncharacterized protein LOC128272290 [Anopheles cruzii]|uniref:uncharacterized protein LOC128272290 n=1 Tax=Anopheles cruzii TaxID=68878 RepID=UPI0022EC7D4A|nr:uncharacterized protein LOC128272290 [Anopheles cruzii]